MNNMAFMESIKDKDIVSYYCSDCGKELTLDEIYYYGFRCEKCEDKWFKSICLMKDDN